MARGPSARAARRPRCLFRFRDSRWNEDRAQSRAIPGRQRQRPGSPGSGRPRWADIHGRAVRTVRSTSRGEHRWQDTRTPCPEEWKDDHSWSEALPRSPGKEATTRFVLPEKDRPTWTSGPMRRLGPGSLHWASRIRRRSQRQRLDHFAAPSCVIGRTTRRFDSPCGYGRGHNGDLSFRRSLDAQLEIGGHERLVFLAAHLAARDQVDEPILGGRFEGVER